MRELCAPAPLCAVALFGLNNHLLKHAYPGWLTGKLSDIACCFFLPLLISAVLGIFTRCSMARRLLLGALCTLLVFAAVKCSATASALLNNVLSALTRRLGLGPSLNRVDPTDLIALPMIALAFWFGARVAAQAERESSREALGS